jgi:adenosylmethionine---8-amino-7-oxononanoate aminotransferase
VRDVAQADRAHVWHPYTPEDDTARPPLVIARAQGSRLYDPNGQSYLDGNASWWTMALGHGHPRLVAALRDQAEQLAHVAMAGITHEPAALLASELCAAAPAGLTRVFYTDNGSGAVEVALRMALQGQTQRGRGQKTRLVALTGAYHGDTLGAASLGDVPLFVRHVDGMRVECLRVPVPTSAGKNEAGYAAAFAAMRALLAREGAQIAAVFVEPLVQGAAGMRIYEAAYLRELRAACTQAGAWLIFDEVFTGYGRTGAMWAAERAGVTPDLMCLGKAFASLVPMGATLATEEVWDCFRGGRDRALNYGHTFYGNPIGARLAREVLSVFKDEAVVAQAAHKAEIIAERMRAMSEVPGVIDTRSLGVIGALDFAGSSGYLGGKGWKVFDEALSRGAYLRPLGDTVYLCPPLTIPDTELHQLLDIMEASVRAVL